MARSCIRYQQLEKLSVHVSSLSSVSELSLPTMQRMRRLLSATFYTSTNDFPLLTPLFSVLYGWGIIWKIVNNMVFCGGNATCMVATATAASQPSKAGHMEVRMGIRSATNAVSLSNEHVPLLH